MTRTIALAALVAAVALVAASTATANHQYGDHRPIVVEKADAYSRSDLRRTLDARERALDTQARSGQHTVEWAGIGIGFVIGTLLVSGVFLIMGRAVTRGLAHR